MELVLIVVLLSVPLLYAGFYFIILLSGKNNEIRKLSLLLQFASFIVYPILFFFLEIGNNDCCSQGLISDGPAFFSPNYFLSIFALMAICVVAFFYSAIRKRLAPPLIEIAINCILLCGIVLSVMMSLHFLLGKVVRSEHYILAVIGFLPVVLWLINMLIKNQRMILEDIAYQGGKDDYLIIKWCRKVLTMPVWQKIPLILVLCLPLLLLLSFVLVIFGQKPDALVQAFTDTYKHGFSEHSCDGVICPPPDMRPDFLCTIAVKGHKNFVKPIRPGIRQNGPILVNRQLLVSNAFEELMEEKLPWLHKPLRMIYNYIGRNATRLFDILGNKWISDIVYILMKPLELFFLLMLYLFTQKPESRIARQYLTSEQRRAIKIGLDL